MYQSLKPGVIQTPKQRRRLKKRWNKNLAKLDRHTVRLNTVGMAAAIANGGFKWEPLEKNESK